jgi:hypothetical protein
MPPQYHFTSRFPLVCVSTLRAKARNSRAQPVPSGAAVASLTVNGEGWAGAARTRKTTAKLALVTRYEHATVWEVERLPGQA